MAPSRTDLEEAVIVFHEADMPVEGLLHLVEHGMTAAELIWGRV